MKPFGQRILVRPETPSSALPGGLVAPETAIRRPETGVVVSVGDQCVTGAWNEFEPGDRVLFARYSGIEMTVDGEPLIVLSTSEVLGIEQGGGEIVPAAV